MKTTNLYLIFFIFFSYNMHAQISSPGLGDGNTASWFALGLRQNLNKKDNIQLMTYMGMGLKSTPQNTMQLSKPAIFVVNQEMYHQLNNHWEGSCAISYRKQYEYLPNKITSEKLTTIQQEFRVYARMAYTFKISNIKLKQTLRQEFRRFVDDHWKNTNEPLQLRTRFKSQVSINLEPTQQHQLTAGAEILFAISKKQQTIQFSPLKYKEARFSAFYTYKPKNTQIAMSVGYMNNLIHEKFPYSVHYASVDVVWINPF